VPKSSWEGEAFWHKVLISYAWNTRLADMTWWCIVSLSLCLCARVRKVFALAQPPRSWFCQPALMTRRAAPAYIDWFARREATSDGLTCRDGCGGCGCQLSQDNAIVLSAPNTPVLRACAFIVPRPAFTHGPESRLWQREREREIERGSERERKCGCSWSVSSHPRRQAD